MRPSGTTGLVTQNANPNTMNFAWQSPGNQYEKQPVVKVDYNLTSKHRLSGDYNWQVVVRDPDHLNGDDVRFPGALNYRKYTSYRPQTSGALRSTLSPNMVNEIEAAAAGAPVLRRPESDGPQTFADTAGYALALGNIGNTLTNWHSQTAQSWRSAWNWNIDDTLSLAAGHAQPQFRRVALLRPRLGEEPADGADDQLWRARSGSGRSRMFTDANFPGSSTRNLDQARGAVRLLTGRVTTSAAISCSTRTPTSTPISATRNQAGRQNEYSLFAQDSWRATPTLTINGGAALGRARCRSSR